MAWLVRLSTIFATGRHGPEAPDQPDVEQLTSALWDLGTTGIQEAPGGEIIAGFDTEPGARTAAEQLSAGHPETIRAAAVEPVPAIGRWPQGDGARTLTVATGRFRFDMEIDPAGVFGHGAHPTTMLALQLLMSGDGPGRRVLDVGTGTGVLAIAAAMAGATEVVAIDIDRRAVSVAADNAARNQVAVTTTSMTIDELLESIDSSTPGSRFDTVVTNVLLPVHRELAADIRRSLGPGGRLVTAGYLVEQADEVVGLYCGPPPEGGAGGDRHNRADLPDEGLLIDDERRAEGWIGHRFRPRR